MNDNQNSSLKKHKFGFVDALRRWGIKKLIYIKNHTHIFPLLFTALSMIFVTCCIFIFNDAIKVMPYKDSNGFLFFVIVMAAIISTVSYLMAVGKHVTKKKKIFMLVIFYILMVLQIVLQVLYMVDVIAEVGTDGSLASPERWFVVGSYNCALIHIILLGLSIALSIIAPLVQPYTKKIQLSVVRNTRKMPENIEKTDPSEKE